MDFKLLAGAAGGGNLAGSSAELAMGGEKGEARSPSFGPPLDFELRLR